MLRRDFPRAERPRQSLGPMKFTKLRIAGFKTFVEPTDFLIEPGLTGIVGPNGCGKSNLVEAMRWVMGESSSKNMRASGMDDVIFSGGGGRPARNMAEVALILDNGARTAPAAFNDADIIEVSRRIERESGSAYRVNGTRGAREGRATPVRRRVLRLALASDGAAGPDRRNDLGEAAGAPPHPRGGRRRRRAAFAPARGGIAPQGRRRQSDASRRHSAAARRAVQRSRASGAAGGALSRPRRLPSAAPRRCAP